MLDNSTQTFHQMLKLSTNQQFMFPQKNDGLICLIGKLVICHRDPAALHYIFLLLCVKKQGCSVLLCAGLYPLCVMMLSNESCQQRETSQMPGEGP